jgi:phospholipase C
MLVISPYAKRNYVDHVLTDQSSIIHFVEDNWLGGERIGQGSFDALSGSINGMFDFNSFPQIQPYILDQSTGEPVNGGFGGFGFGFGPF